MKKEEKSILQWKEVFQGNVLAFGLVSFLTDISTEMIYPLLPVCISGFMPSAAVAVDIGMDDCVGQNRLSPRRLSLIRCLRTWRTGMTV